MKHQQRLAQVRQAFLKFLLGNIIEKLALDTERSPSQLHLDFSLLSYFFDMVFEQADDVRRIIGRRNCNHRAGLGNAVRSG